MMKVKKKKNSQAGGTYAKFFMESTTWYFSYEFETRKKNRSEETYAQFFMNVKTFNFLPIFF